MSVHAVHSSMLSGFIPQPGSIQPQIASSTTQAQKLEADQVSYGLPGGPFSENGTAAGLQGNQVYRPLASDVANGVDPAVLQTPATESLTGSPTYNYRGQLNASHASPGHQFQATA